MLSDIAEIIAVLLVCLVLDGDEVVSHGLVGQLVKDRAHRVKASVHDDQLSLGLLLRVGSHRSSREVR